MPKRFETAPRWARIYPLRVRIAPRTIRILTGRLGISPMSIGIVPRWVKALLLVSRMLGGGFGIEQSLNGIIGTSEMLTPAGRKAEWKKSRKDYLKLSKSYG